MEVSLRRFLQVASLKREASGLDPEAVHLFPDREEPARLALPGAAVAAGGWTLLGTGFRVYAGVAGQFSLYGVLGAALLLVTWYYVGSMALLVGAGVNAVLAGRADETGTNKSPPPDSQPNDSV